MSTAVTKHEPIITIVPQAELADIIRLDEASRAAHKQLLEASMAGNEMAKAFIMTRSIHMLRQLLTDKIMNDIMGLMNNPLGFKTDRPNKSQQQAYSMPQVRDVLIQGLIRGVRPTHNEMNIIAGGLYITKEGYERLTNELPGVSALRIEVGVPTNKDGGALVNCKASWKLNGVPDSLVCEGPYAIPIKVNEGMGSDAIQGKATSKMLRRIYKIISNMDVSEEDDSPEAPLTLEGTAKPVA